MQRLYIRQLYLFLGFLLVFILFFSSKGSAQTKTSLTVAPAIVELSERPGAKIERSIRLENKGDQALPVSIEVQSFLDADNLQLRSSKYDASTWIALETYTYLFGVDESISIPVTVAIPEDASPGGHYAQMRIRGLVLEDPQFKDANSLVIPELTVNIFITVAGEISESFVIDSWDAGSRQVGLSSPLRARLNVTNDGNVHNVVSPKLHVYKGGTLIDTQLFAPQTILPESSRLFELDWTSPDEYGSYKAEVELVYGSTTMMAKASNILLVTPHAALLVGIALATWTSMYMFAHRQNVRGAIKAFKNG